MNFIVGWLFLIVVNEKKKTLAHKINKKMCSISIDRASAEVKKKVFKIQINRYLMLYVCV